MPPPFLKKKKKKKGQPWKNSHLNYRHPGTPPVPQQKGIIHLLQPLRARRCCVSSSLRFLPSPPPPRVGVSAAQMGRGSLLLLHPHPRKDSISHSTLASAA